MEHNNPVGKSDLSDQIQQAADRSYSETKHSDFPNEGQPDYYLFSHGVYYAASRFVGSLLSETKDTLQILDVGTGNGAFNKVNEDWINIYELLNLEKVREQYFEFRKMFIFADDNELADIS